MLEREVNFVRRLKRKKNNKQKENIGKQKDFLFFFYNADMTFLPFKH